MSSPFTLRCTECARTYSEAPNLLVCRECASKQEAGGTTRGVLSVDFAALPDRLGADTIAGFLPVSSPDALPPLPVGGTPLLPVPALREHLGMPRLWVKDDTRNPSGSTKDRASHLVVAKAIEYGLETIATASTGNAAAALAAVCAAAGRTAVVFVPADAPEAKLVQTRAYGAIVVPVAGTYDDAFELCVAACREYGLYNRNTAQNPYTIEGKKTAALEIAAQMAPEVPDAVVVPVGDGVILGGVAKGFRDLVRAGILDDVPRLVAVQAAGSPAIHRAFRHPERRLVAVPDARSVADSLTVAMPRNGLGCLRAIEESGGAVVLVPEEEVLAAVGHLARTTGVFAEPAAAASLAGLLVARREGIVAGDERVVLVVTGSGLKDVPAAGRAMQRIEPVAPTLEALAERPGLPGPGGGGRRR